MSWTIERKSPMVAVLRLPEIKRVEEERWVLLMSDEHADNAHSDLGLIRAHHEQAAERNAPILKFGDTFCAMQGKWDRRSDQEQLRPELRGNGYLDRLMDFHQRLYEPYAKSIAVISDGNHETSILQHHQTHLTERLVDRLRRAGSPAVLMGFTGFVRISCGNGSGAYSWDLHFHHGYGGGGEVTRGMIDNNRTRSQYHADVYYSGHIHRRNMDENVVMSINHQGRVEKRTQLFLRGGAYKHEEGAGGWHVERGRSARPAGGWWLRIKMSRPGNDREFHLTAVPA